MCVLLVHHDMTYDGMPPGGGYNRSRCDPTPQLSVKTWRGEGRHGVGGSATGGVPKWGGPARDPLLLHHGCRRVF